MSIIRDITIKIGKDLESPEALLFVGPRQAGKTTLLKQLQHIADAKGQPTYFINLEDPDYLRLLNESPKNLFKLFPFNTGRRSFVYIDEVQYLADPSNFLKYLYDEYREMLKIFASGSSAFYVDRKFKNSLAGRKKIFNVLTLSFREFLRFKNEQLLADKDFRDLAFSEHEKIGLLWREFGIWGGYPRVVLAPPEEKVEILRDIAYSYIKKDVLEADIRKEEIFYKLCKVLAAQIGNLVNASELANTLEVSKTSIDHYLYVMQKSFHIKLLKPFFKNMRKELTRMPKAYFIDTGLRNFFVDNFQPFETRPDAGPLLENMAYRQLLENQDADRIRFWRTTQGCEVDFIVGESSAIAVKMQPAQFNKRVAKTLRTQYPEMGFRIATMDASIQAFGQHPVCNAWEL